MSTNEIKPTISESSSREEILVGVGAMLAEKRQEQGLSMDVVTHALKLRNIYLKALESGDWAAMPGEVYALAFLRQYAMYLHVDLDDTLEKLKSGHYKLTKPLTFPDPPIAPNKTWMAIASLCFLLLFVGINIIDQEPAPLPSELLQHVAKDMVAVKKPVKPALEHSNKDAKIASLPLALNMQEKVSIPEEKTKKTPIVSYIYTFTAVSNDVWLQLHNHAKPPVLVREVLLKKGESMVVKTPQLLSLTCGNARALQIDLNQQRLFQVNQLGEEGEVLHNYLLQMKK